MFQRSGPAVWFVLSLVLALMAAGVAYFTLSSATQGVPVVVATKAIAPLEPIPSDAVTVETRPASGLPKDAVRDASQVVGKYTRTGLVPGVVVQEAMLAGTPAEGVAGIDAKLQELAKESGKPLRAYPLALTAAEGYRIVQPGQTVDVIAHVKNSNGATAGVLVQNVTVLAKVAKDGAGQSSSPLPTRGNDGEGDAPEGVVILALAPEDAARVTMAQDLGTVVLAPRPIGDKETPAVRVLSDVDLMTASAPSTAPSTSQAEAEGGNSQ
ncbi:MAG TPA: Flp pilus assembly protein CpaB [Thermaerobacter sp.]